MVRHCCLPSPIFYQVVACQHYNPCHVHHQYAVALILGFKASISRGCRADATQSWLIQVYSDALQLANCVASLIRWLCPR